jgi:CheY-like chemotaxis protein
MQYQNVINVEVLVMKSKKIGEIFVEKGLLSDKTVERVVIRSKKLNKRIGTILVENEIITDSELSEALAAQYNFKFVGNILKYSYPQELFKLIDIDFAIQNLVFPLRITGKRLSIAVADPTNLKTLTIFASNNDFELDVYVASRNDILSAISKFYLGNDAPETQKPTVLIVEDSADERKLLSLLISGHGFRCIDAKDGLEGFKQAVLANPQVIITDKVMPKLDGYRLLEALKKVAETEKIPVILITGTSNSQEELTAFEKGFFDFIKKPYDELSVITRVKRALQFSLK